MKATMKVEFDAIKALRIVREKRALRRRKPFRKSKLDQYRGEILMMHRDGGSLGEIADWLEWEKNVTVDISTICRYLKKVKDNA